jgi:hypothetical protein
VVRLGRDLGVGLRGGAYRLHEHVVAAGAVEHEQVEWRRGRALLDAAVDLEARELGAVEEQLLDRGRIAP